MNLLKSDWDYVEKLIEDALNKRLRTYDDYKYMIIDSDKILVKVYEENQLVFTIKFRLFNGELQVTDAW